MSIEKLGIPYMGSKRKLASEILSKIIQRLFFGTAKETLTITNFFKITCKSN